MRAFEITILLIVILTAPSVLYAMGVVPTSTNTCTTIECQASQTIYSMASGFQLQSVDFNANPGQVIWDTLTLTVTFPIYAFFWMLYFLSVIVLVAPALESMFLMPAIFAKYIMIGLWVLWLAAYVQWKRGGLGIDAYR